ncbi:ABC transporter permease [Oscillibacter sp. MSJ-2]|uniref:ABC transporter permease n=1 Tax=Dysosmobacter acutus TaxID=2841504 RepID=A0ABS6F7A3_9FIRM|nr:ABC transporter permease [Dysosmobacter acutus]MBU5625556.1 ABC transporter permease [Dysosmobacter acutus]
MNSLGVFLGSVVMMAATYLLAGMGAVFGERAGIVNIGIEGLMLTGALLAVVGSYAGGSVWIGLLLAISGAVLLSAVFAFFTVGLQANQTVTGVALNILASGLTVLVFRTVFGLNGMIPRIDTFEPVAIPLLSSLPVVGTLFRQPVPVYLAFALVPVCSFVMHRTNLGLIVRSVGNNPRACDTVGLPVHRVQVGTILFTGLMSGMAGAFLSTGQLSFFTEGMVAGRGYMVLAAVVFGNYSPLGVMGAALLFGASEALQYRLQVASTGIPTEVWAMLPYAITLLAICAYRRRSNRPVCSGRNYVR